MVMPGGADLFKGMVEDQLKGDKMIDWHCHILPGIDDGAVDMEQSLAMAVSLAKVGFTTVYCTPHLMRGCYEVENARVLMGMSELQDQIDASGIGLTLRAGREYCLDEFLLEYLQEPLTLDDKRSVLVEIPPRTTADTVRQLLYGLVRAGFKPVIAHPERCHLLEPSRPHATGRGLLDTMKGLFGSRSQEFLDTDHISSTGNPLLDYLRDLGCLFQGNLGSFSGFYGRQVKDVANVLRSRGLYDRYGSDLHAPQQAAQVLKQPLPY
jgi:protein-tyrosine phosphatase